MNKPGLGAGELKVVVDRPHRRRLLTVAALLLCGAMAYGGYRVGQHVADLDRSYVAALERIKGASELQLAQLRSELIDARLAYEVDSQALVALRGDLTGTREEMAKLEEEVSFYRSLMDPKSVAKGLQIAAFDTLPLASGKHSYHLLLTQVATRRAWLSGTVKIALSGDGAKGPQVLPLTELSSPDVYPLKFRFRYFQDLRGELQLPAGFVPRSALITVTRSGKKALERSFPWPLEP